MTSRAEITSRYAKAYKAASKKDRGRLLDEVVSVTGWSRDNARRRLTAAAAPAGRGTRGRRRPRRRRSPKYSYDALKVLQRVWAASGGQCGKYLAVSMPLLVDGLEEHGELVVGQDRYSVAVRETARDGAATIDRYSAGARTRTRSGIATTKPSPLLRSSITIRKAGDEVEAEPGFFEGDTVAHCGPTIKGEFARTVNLTACTPGGCSPARSATTPHPRPRRAPGAVAGDPVRGGRAGLRQRRRVPQPRRHRVGRRPEDLLHPLPAVQEERPGHHRVEEQPPRASLRLLLPLRHPRGARVLNRLWSWSTTGSTTSPRPRSPSAGTPTATGAHAGSTTSHRPHWIGCSGPGSSHRHKNESSSLTAHGSTRPTWPDDPRRAIDADQALQVQDRPTPRNHHQDRRSPHRPRGPPPRNELNPKPAGIPR